MVDPEAHLPHADDTGRRLRRRKMQALHEHSDCHGHGLIYQPSRWPYHIFRTAFSAIQGAVPGE